MSSRRSRNISLPGLCRAELARTSGLAVGSPRWKCFFPNSLTTSNLRCSFRNEKGEEPYPTATASLAAEIDRHGRNRRFKGGGVDCRQAASASRILSTPGGRDHHRRQTTEQTRQHAAKPIGRLLFRGGASKHFRRLSS